MTPREWIGITSLSGTHVRLEQLHHRHVQGLFEATAPDTFKYFSFWPSEWTLACFTAMVQEHIDAPGRLHFAVVDPASGKPVGSTSYLDIKPEHKALEIGFTWYAPAARGTLVNPESKLLLLTHAFETLDCQRVQLKCDARNMQSQRAIAKLGAQREGVMRKTMILPDGHVRDTMMFSIVREEWGAVKAGLEARLRDRSSRA